MDLDLPQLQEELGAAGGAATGFLSILGRIPSVAGIVQSAMVGARTSLTQAGQDARAAGQSINDVASNVASKVPAAANSLTKMGQTAQAVGGVLKQALTGDVRGALSSIGSAVESSIGKLQERLAQMGPYGQAAAAAIGVLEVVISKTVGSMLDFMGAAIKISETKAAVAAAFDGISGGKGAAVLGTLGKLSEALPYSGSQIRAWAQALLATGTPADQLAGRIKAIASAEALMAAAGGGGGAAAEALFKRLSESDEAANKLIKDMQGGGRRSMEMLAGMGLSVKDVAKALGMSEEAFKKAKIGGDQMAGAVQKALQAKGADSLTAAMGSWSVILDKAKGGFMSLLGGLGGAKGPVSEFMGAVKRLFSEFNAGSPIIRGLKPIVTSVFTTLFQWATMAVNAIHKGFLMIAIAALTVYIAARPIIQTFGKILSHVPGMQILKVLLLGIAGVALAFVGPFLLAAAVVGGLVAALAAVLAYLYEWAEGAAGAAGNFVSGLVGGITAGAGAFVDAVKSLASQGMAAFTSFFGIKSPSTKMLKHGEENIAGAATTGVDKGADKFQDAMASLGGEPPKGGGKPGVAGAKGGGRSVTVTIGTVVTPDARTFVQDLYGELERMDAEALT